MYLIKPQSIYMYYHIIKARLLHTLPVGIIMFKKNHLYMIFYYFTSIHPK